MRVVHILPFVFLASVPLCLFAYDDGTTHPALSAAIVHEFNRQYPERALSRSAEIALVQGSIDEDREWRFMRHFYDPVYRRGLDAFTAANDDRPWMSAREWMHAMPDASWESARASLEVGKTDEAFYRVGHVLHLLEDMSVPDHTRNDPHPPAFIFGSPYEKFTRQFAPATFLGVPGDIGALPHAKTPEELFDHMAEWSNSQFISRDTGTNDRYARPDLSALEERIEKVSGHTERFVRGTIEGVSYPVARVVRSVAIAPATATNAYILDDKDRHVLTAYWYLLSREAVRSGVELLRLFTNADEPVARVERPASLDETAIVSPRDSVFDVEVRRADEQHAEISRAVTVQLSAPAHDIGVLLLPGPEPVDLSRRVAAEALRGTGIAFDVVVAPEASLPIRDTDPTTTPTLPQADSSTTSDPISESTDPPPATEESSSTPPADDPPADPPPADPARPVTLPIVPLTILPAAGCLSSGVVYTIAEIAGVPTGTTFCIGPGAIIKFGSGASLQVNGTLEVAGTATEPVVFTSMRDDEYGGDSNGDGLCLPDQRDEGASCPVAGDWFRVLVEDISPRATISHALFRYGGEDRFSLHPTNERGMLSARFSVVDLSDSRLEFAKRWAISTLEGTTTIAHSTISKSGLGFSNFGGARLSHGYVAVSDSLFEENMVGLSVGSARGDIVRNQFRNNVSRSFDLNSAFVGELRNNSGTGNGRNGISFALAGGIAGEPAVLPGNPGFPYLFDRGPVNLDQGKTIRFTEGAHLKFAGITWAINGHLDLLGSADNPIRVMSVDDDSDGNDAHGNGLQSTVSFPRGIVFVSAGTGYAEHLIVSIRVPPFVVDTPGTTVLQLSP